MCCRAGRQVVRRIDVVMILVASSDSDGGGGDVGW